MTVLLWTSKMKPLDTSVEFCSLDRVNHWCDCSRYWWELTRRTVHNSCHLFSKTVCRDGLTACSGGGKYIFWVRNRWERLDQRVWQRLQGNKFSLSKTNFWWRGRVWYIGRERLKDTSRTWRRDYEVAMNKSKTVMKMRFWSSLLYQQALSCS